MKTHAHTRLESCCTFKLWNSKADRSIGNVEAGWQDVGNLARHATSDVLAFPCHCRAMQRGARRGRERKKNTRKESRLVEEGARKWSTARVKMHHTATNQERGRSMISLRNLLRSFYNTALIVSVRWKPITDNCTLCTDLAFFLR